MRGSTSPLQLLRTKEDGLYELGRDLTWELGESFYVVPRGTTTRLTIPASIIEEHYRTTNRLVPDYGQMLREQGTPRMKRWALQLLEALR
jgi:hypothetical protein